jgi:hypothetical protein
MHRARSPEVGGIPIHRESACLASSRGSASLETGTEAGTKAGTGTETDAV